MSEPSGRSFQQNLRHYCIALVILTAIAWAVVAFNSLILHLPFPFNWPLLNPRARFSDLTDFYVAIRDLKQGSFKVLAFGGPAFIYPTPALAIYALLIRPFSNPLAAYFSVCAAICLFALFALRKAIGPAGNASALVNASLAFDRDLFLSPLIRTRPRQHRNHHLRLHSGRAHLFHQKVVPRFLRAFCAGRFFQTVSTYMFLSLPHQAALQRHRYGRTGFRGIELARAAMARSTSGRLHRSEKERRPVLPASCARLPH